MTVGPTRDYLKQEAIKQSWKEYKKSLLLMERSVADLSLRYIRKTDRLDDPFPTGKLPNENAGPLLQFANLYSSRYLDLYTAYVSIEYKKGIPMVPVTAGQMKLHGFTSEDIIQMQPECKAYSSIVTTLKTILNEDGNKAYDRLVVIMVGNDKLTRQEAIHLSKADFELKTGVALSDKQHQDIITQFKAYDQLPAPGASLIKKAHFLMHEFGHLPYESIANQLAAVGKMDPRTLPNESAQTDARLLMEIRHRVSGDSTIHQNSPGTLGGNPLSYLNVLTRGEPENPEAEFRNKMFFVYMSNHFANAVIQNDEKIGEINQWLKDNGKDWSLDMNFITTMRQRGAQYMPPIFRYGANANLNREFRHIKSDEDVAHFYQRNPNVSLVEAMEESAHFNALHRVKLSDREYFNQIGELGYTQNDPRNEQQLNFGTGAAIFDLATAPSSTMSHETQTYLRDISELGIPVCAGISGTLDQSTAMAGLVGLGVHEDMDVRRYELETIRLAYLAFMLPGGDHTVHEIMQSGKTFGLPYIGGPGYEAYIYPEDGGYIKEQLRLMQELRGSHLPEYFFSEEYLDKVLDDCEARASSSQVEREKFYERLDAAKLNTLNPELMKKLSPKEYQAILAFFTDDQNTLLKGQLSQLEKGQSCRFAKEDTGLPRTINIFRNREGEYKLLVDTKRKLADGIKDLNAPVVHGAGKSSWRLDVQEEYLGVTTSVDPHDQKHGAYLDEIKIKSERTQAFGERSSAICATDIGVEFDKGDTKKVTVYSRKAIGTLDTVLERLGDNTGAKNKLISDLLHGVKAMHDLGYVHQDLKPENLLVYDDGQGGYTLKLTGFDGVKKQGDDRQYAAGAHKFQSPELAYYYTNAFDKDNANRDYGQKYYAQELGLIGRLAIDSPEGAEKYPQQAQLREQYKLPNKGNDMWAVGMLVYYIQHGILPETVSDIEQAKTCPLLKGLLDISRDDRIDIDSAISINQSIVASEGRQFDKKEEGQRYYVAISLKDAPTSGVGQDSRQTLGDDMAQCLENLGGQGIQRIDRDNWHVTVGWLENRASENTPISAEDYNRIAPAIASIVEKYAQLEFELSDFSPNEEKLGVHANFNEKTGQLESLRHEIKEMVHQIAPQVDFKFSRPHALVASSQAPIDKDKLTPVTTAKIYGISNIDMMYYDDKTHRPVIAEQYSTHSTTPPPVAEKLQDSHEEASVGLEPTLDGLVVTPQNAKEKETKPVAHAPTFFAAAPQYKKQLTQFKDEPPVDVAGTVVGNIQKQ